MLRDWKFHGGESSDCDLMVYDTALSYTLKMMSAEASETLVTTSVVIRRHNPEYDDPNSEECCRI
jgi:hypothetical protein